MTEHNDESQWLTLGWTMTRGFDPSYWVRDEASIGGQSREDLVLVPSESVAAHTVIIAQSGSGKSFFLGRLIEEILLHTKARCLVLDPNGDFLGCHYILETNNNGPCMWTRPKYDRTTSLGFLTHERRREEFELPWKAIETVVRTVNPSESLVADGTFAQLCLPWTSLSSELLAADVEPIIKGQVMHCHEFVREVAKFREVEDILSETEDLLGEISADEFSKEHGRDKLAKRYDLDKIGEEFFQRSAEYHTLHRRLQDFKEIAKKKRSTRMPSKGFVAPSNWLLSMFYGLRIALTPEDMVRYLEKTIEIGKNDEKQRLYQALDTALKVAPYITEGAAKFYFGKARLLEESGIFDFATKQQQEVSSEKDLEVIALSSISKLDVRRMAVSSIVETEINRARDAWEGVVLLGDEDKRVPVFIVIDEAHNLIPSDAERNTAEAALLQQFRTIAAEGRKYGVFLLIVSQRPDKLDERIVSECENKIVMKIGSHRVLDITKRLLGLEDLPPKDLEKCLDFPKGRALIAGDWSRTPQTFFVAARRTKEGGKNLNKDHWATPRKEVEDEFSKQQHLRQTLAEAGFGNDAAMKKLVAELNLKIIRDLVALTADELMEVDGFGRKSLARVTEKLWEMKLKLKEN